MAPINGYGKKNNETIQGTLKKALHDLDMD